MATSSNQQTDLRKVYYQCRLGRDDLDRLFAVASDGISPGGVQISTIAGNTRYWEATLTELVAAVRTGTPEVGHDWTNISLKAETPSGERSVTITLDKERAELNVAGADSTWVYGQTARLEAFLTAHGAAMSSPKYEMKVSLAFLAFFCAFGYFWLTRGGHVESAEECIKKAQAARGNQVYINAAIGAMLAVGVLGVLFKVFKERASRARLLIDGSIPAGSWWARLTVSEKIATIGIPVAALATIGTLVSAASDVFGK
ncbi:hypothetical protein ACFW08_26185 [Streptomyces sp. NPDC058960]|uniref:hypothetical protein n=1 Tax=Streptomyces sp. NPDC058960 TaxID=3346679 RepID=UPI00369CF116